MVQMCTAGIPAISSCFTIVAPQRVHVPQVDVRRTPLTPALSSVLAMSFPRVRSISTALSAPFFHGKHSYGVPGQSILTLQERQWVSTVIQSTISSPIRPSIHPNRAGREKLPDIPEACGRRVRWEHSLWHPYLEWPRRSFRPQCRHVLVQT